jgi:hypothetical protein
MALESTAGVLTFKIRRVILKVKKGPELKAGIGDGKADPMVARLLTGIRKVRMLVHVEHAPNLVIGQELVPLALRVALGVPFSHCRSLDEGLGNAALIIDLDDDQRIAEGCPQILEVSSLCDASFADDQDAPFRLSPGSSAPEILGGAPPVPSTQR